MNVETESAALRARAAGAMPVLTGVAMLCYAANLYLLHTGARRR